MRTNHWIRKGIFVGVLIVLAGIVFPAQASTTIGITGDGRFFTINGTPTYLNGVSYYGAQTITTSSYVEDDLDDMVDDGFNWIRVWMYWTDPVTDEDVSVMTDSGSVRSTYMNRLKNLIAECDERGIIVDCSFTRDGYNTWVGPTNQTQHLAAVQTLATELYSYTNIYFDLSNECTVGDGRYVSPAELIALKNRAKQYKPGVLCTASATPQDEEDMQDWIIDTGLDFCTPHLCRDSGCAALTYGTVKDMISWLENNSTRVPILLQEPFRRGYDYNYNPVTSDYLRDCVGGKNADAAGWCLHNGGNYGSTPYRSFRMTNSDGRLYSQWETAEQNVCDQIDDHIGGTNPFVRLYQAEWDEQLSKQIGRSDGDARSANVAQDSTGYLTYGPYTKAFAAGGYQATWRMMIDNNTADNANVVTIDVNDPDGGGVRATRTITRQEFTSASTYQDFTLNFTHTNASHRLEFRTLWYDNSYLKVNYVKVHQQPTTPVINEVTPDPQTINVYTPYTKQLSLSAGYPDPTWSVITGPAGLTVNSNGYVSGWTPDADDIDDEITITIRATNSQGYDNETWVVEVSDLITTYEGGSGFSHVCGSSISNDDWRKTTATNNCYMGYGPYTTSLPSGYLTARWWLRVDNNTYDNANICTIDVFDADATSVLATRTITRLEWSQANVYQAFNVYFNNPGGHRIEFRTYYIWYSQLDLDKVEVLYGATNQAPSVNAGNDQTINWPTNTASLDGTVTDDGLPNPPGAVSVTWTKQSGAGTVSFANANAVDTTATFSATGTYVLRLTASDGTLSNYDEVTITVSSCTPTLQATYQGSTGFYHQCGALTGTDDWRVTTATNNCFMGYGPYTSALSAGNKTAKWYLRVDNNTYDDANIVQIDVYDSTGSQYLAGPYTISRYDFNQAGVYQAFELNFTNPGGGHQLEFRTFYIWYSQLDMDKVEVWTRCN